MPFAAAPASGLCCRGDALASLSELQMAIVVIGVVYWFSPNTRETIVDALNRRGVTTLMCGDGTNDVGELKRAPVGVSILGEQRPGSRSDYLPHRKMSLR